MNDTLQEWLATGAIASGLLGCGIIFPFPFFLSPSSLTAWNCPPQKSARPSKLALAEDIGSGDATTLATVPEMRRPKPSCARANRSSSPESPLPKPRSANFLPRKSKSSGSRTVNASAGERFAENFRPGARHFERRARRAEFCPAAFRRRHADRAIRGSRQRNSRRFSTRAKPRPAGGVLRNTPSPAAAEKIIASVCST
jgi:hypothetical protein